MTMNIATIKQWPEATIKESDVAWEKRPLPDSVEDGKILVENIYYSVDPTHRIYMTDRESYMPRFKLGQELPSLVIGKVLKGSGKVAAGDTVATFGQIGSHSIAPMDMTTPIESGSDLLPYLTLFNPVIGLTAHAGLGICDVSKPVAGDKHCIVISGAAGAVGSLAGQLAKARGAFVVGIAGGPEKCAKLKDLGFDEAVDYKAHKSNEALIEAIKTASKSAGGVDSYFDNVGGEVSASVFENFKLHARVALCGAISQYDAADTEGRISFPAWNVLLYKRAVVTGFICLDHIDTAKDAFAELGKLYGEGKIKTPDLDIVEGTEGFVTQLQKLVTSKNTGKTAVKVSA